MRDFFEKLKPKIIFIIKRIIYVLSNNRGSIDIEGIKDDLSRIISIKREVLMKAVLYMPKGKKEVQDLQKNIAKIHAEAVITKLNSLELTTEKTNLLIDKIKDNIENRKTF